ncbi:TIGR01458 family HAD-type hydrolase [Nitratiruptor sp. SB155-2]|uniref:TIGR01458 family HAD-type hydrolase n=1 Tax=Nitratiruptor sp. (strain SB155-2) TaxID=387092 RepID=UPI0001587356|nr:TIGR01458 family HAD-type hydrolase [Nitratiruptor sp. SB155-2]BAF70159.1 HAD-superfamily hydrolase, subfamily IIA [Nitratiruptor sp. SB155-2]
MKKGILLDIGGVLYEGDSSIKGAKEALCVLRERYTIRFLSNTSRVPPKNLLEKLRNMGFDIYEEELFTALSAAKLFLKSQNAKAYVIGTDEAKNYFDDLDGAMKYVLVCDAYKNFTYDALNEGFRYLESGAGFIATNMNRYFKDIDGLSLDAGGFVKCLEYASDKMAKILGKPNCEFFALALESMGLKKEEVVMVGDDIESDILGAKACWITTVMVKTGKFKEKDLLKGRPDFLIESIADLPKLMEEV